MTTVAWCELGAVAGTCTVCGAEAALTMGEARCERSLIERLRREYVSPPARFVTCTDCGWRWSVRATDRSGEGVQRRVPDPSEDDAIGDDAPVVATRTVLPATRDGRRRSRDWAYPQG